MPLPCPGEGKAGLALVLTEPSSPGPERGSMTPTPICREGGLRFRTLSTQVSHLPAIVTLVGCIGGPLLTSVPGTSGAGTLLTSRNG